MQRDQLKGIIMELKINYITGYAGTGKITEINYIFNLILF